MLWKHRKENFFFFWPCRMACGILVPQLGIKPMPSAVKVQSPNHWTGREFPKGTILQKRWHFNWVWMNEQNLVSKRREVRQREHKVQRNGIEKWHDLFEKATKIQQDENFKDWWSGGEMRLERVILGQIGLTEYITLDNLYSISKKLNCDL